MLFGIALMLGSGFKLFHDLLLYGNYGRTWTTFAALGLILGFVVVTLGLVYGSLADAGSGD
ncbi:hypothetical protein [Salinilacihabitans rarus]|uniref:hypothetical protein n=1 Tax=Salinilacihabitans rarus TaxID=2961596 RepID=UPI0020C8E9DE|nr:hypothetical protein [Salinilacihabitans rarus]